MATRTYDYSESSAISAEEAQVRGSGWLMFAAVMLGLAGSWSIIDGILALGRSKVYGVDSVYIFSDLRTWGWIMLFLGAAEVVAAFALFSGSELARWFGIAIAGINAIGQLGFVSIYPWWALAMFAADVLIIYGLAVYAGHQLREA
jgi:hypothetical protein